VALVYLSGAWVVGILLGGQFELPAVWLLTGLIPLGLAGWLRSRKRPLILMALCLLALFAGAWRYQSSLPTAGADTLSYYNNRGIVLVTGLVSTDPEVSNSTTQLRLRVSAIQRDQEWQPIMGTALLMVPGYPVYSYGDVLQVTGELTTPPQLDTFDYRGYLAHQGIYSTMTYPQITILDRGQGSSALTWLYRLRHQLSRTITRVLPEPLSSLAQAMLLGIRGHIPDMVKADFVHSGTAHLLAISGLHLSIMVGILLSLGIWLLGRRGYTYIWLALVTIWLYTGLTGMHPPVIRAAIMVSLFLLADLLGRQRSAITGLALAAAIMTGIQPQILGDASFQLSFLAMTGLVLIAPQLKDLSHKVLPPTLEPGRLGSLARVTMDSGSVSLGAILATWPVIAYHFGIVSLVAPLATLLALPALPGLIITVALTGFLGLASTALAQVASWLAWLFLSYLLLIVDLFAAIPLSSITTDAARANFIWIYYPVLGLALWVSSRHQRANTWLITAGHAVRSGVTRIATGVQGVPLKWLVPPLLVVAVLTSLTAASMPDGNLHISFLSVGNGDAILIQQGNQQILIDGGPDTQAVIQEISDRMPFWDRTIDLVVMTHPHSDHLRGLVGVLPRYQVKQVLCPQFDYQSPLYHQWLGLIADREIKVTLAQAGQQITLGELVISVLHPPPAQLSGTDSDIDNNSLVLRITRGEISFLLTADIHREAELGLLTSGASLGSTVLKVAHHGSDTSTSPEFLAVVNPQLAVITVGADNPFGHPGSEAVLRLEQQVGRDNIHRTDRQGTIEIITDGHRLWVKTQATR